MATSSTRSTRHHPPSPPPLDALPLVHASDEVTGWLEHYWHKLHLPRDVASRLAVTTDRQEFAVWTGRRLNPLALGCYCYLPDASGGAAEIGCGQSPAALNTGPGAASAASAASAPSAAGRPQDSGSAHLQPALPGFDPAPAEAASTAATSSDYRHLIFVEPDLLPINIEVTVAHELIHLRDRVSGKPRKHRCHGYDAISVDEAALTERDPEFLRAQLREEAQRREEALRAIRPYRYIYVCPACHREYPRVRRYPRPVSCGRCDRTYNLAFVLQLREVGPTSSPSAPGGPGGPSAPAAGDAVADGAWNEAAAGVVVS